MTTLKQWREKRKAGQVTMAEFLMFGRQFWELRTRLALGEYAAFKNELNEWRRELKLSPEEAQEHFRSYMVGVENEQEQKDV